MTLKRINKQADYTEGILLVDGEYLCDTLEPTWRDIGRGRPGRKVAGRTAIPEGRYPVVITWSIGLKEWLPLLLKVPRFEGIRVHAGNTVRDTRGCVLVGRFRKAGVIDNSRYTLRRVKDAIVQAKERGEGVWITVE